MDYIADVLPSILSDSSELSQQKFLSKILDGEIEYRNPKRHHRNLTASHFPHLLTKRLKMFDARKLDGALSATLLDSLRQLHWLAVGQNIFIFGPPDLDKIMLSIGLDLDAVDAGYTVCFERMSNLIELLDKEEFHKQSHWRMNKIKKKPGVIIDKIGFVPITREQATKFFIFVCDLYGKASFIFTTNKNVSQWSEILGNPVLTH